MSIIEGKGLRERQRMALQIRLDAENAETREDAEELKELYVMMSDSAKELAKSGMHLECLWDKYY